MKAPTVVNKYKEEYDIYIGRGSKWGNPFSIGEHGTREDVIKAYRKHLWSMINTGRLTDKDFFELSGKRMGCFCKPQDCHGDVIVSCFNWIFS